MPAFLVDESCPRAVVNALKDAGHDVRYAADANRRALDTELVVLAETEGRLIVSEDFDFGELLIRHQLKAPGAIILHLPRSSPEQRAERLVAVLATKLILDQRLTIVTLRQVRQRTLPG
jgi:predicted nuclease of predicted toxin-antitoxin system